MEYKNINHCSYLEYTNEEKYELVYNLAFKKAYAPYSKFPVGALIIFEDGSYQIGFNIENVSYGLTICAERSAIFSALVNGYDLSQAKEIVIIGDSTNPISPCGACRQVMSEFFDLDIKITLFNLKKQLKTTSLKELLPYSIGKGDMFDI